MTGSVSTIFPLALILVWIFCLFIHKIWYRRKSTLEDIPWGYRGVYGIGLLPYLKGPGSRNKLIEIGEKGKICCVQIGSFRCIWLNEYHTIKDAWSRKVFCGRPDLDGISVRTENIRGGIIFNDGPEFSEQRKFAMATLRAAGFGKELCHEYVHEEIADLINTLKARSNTPISTRHLFNLPVFNIIWQLVTGGSRFQANDPVMSKLVEVLNRNMELNDGACVAFFMPWLSKYFPGFTGWNQYVEDSHYIFQFWRDFAFRAVRPEMEYPPTSFLYAYREKITSCEDTSSSFFGTRGVTSLAIVLQDLFIAGSETTATLLQWICLYLSKFPHCQYKIYNEILSAFNGHTSPIRQNDMPYTCAFIKESLRYSTLAPLGMLHSTLEDVSFHGYFIPKGTLIQMNMCAVHFHKNCWKDPHDFNPERFLYRENGHLKVLTGEISGFLPFSLGQRLCPGADVAKETLFTAIVYIVQNFHVDRPPDDTVHLEPKIGVSAVPYPHKIIFKQRNRYNRENL